MIWFDKLLTKSRAFTLSKNKQITEFFTALENEFNVFVGFINDIFFDIWPSTTRQLDEWDLQFGLTPDDGLTEQQRRDRLDAAWKRTGGQDPRYIQDTLQAAGFNVYIYEWWEPGTNPPVPRNPNDFVAVAFVPPVCGEADAQCGEPTAQCTGPGFSPGVFNFIVEAGEVLAEAGEVEAEAGNYDEPNSGEGYVLVNKIFTSNEIELFNFGDADAEFGEPAVQFAKSLGVTYGRKVYPIPNDPTKWPYFLYFCNAIYGVPAVIPTSRRDEFENLLLEICPAQQWLALAVIYN